MLGKIPKQLAEQIEPYKQECLAQIVELVAQAGGYITAEELRQASLEQVLDSLIPNSIYLYAAKHKAMGVAPIYDKH